MKRNEQVDSIHFNAKCFQSFNQNLVDRFIGDEKCMIWLQTGTKIIYNLVIKDFGVFSWVLRYGE